MLIRGSCEIERRLSNFCLPNKTAGHVENVIIVINNALAQKENTSFTVDMRIIFHIIDILND